MGLESLDSNPPLGFMEVEHMKWWIKLNTKAGEPDRTAKLKPDEFAAEVIGVKCQCGAEPMFVSGTGKRISQDPKLKHDTYEADAVCTKCNGHVGIIYAQVSTLFGLEEDERTMNMGIRIY